MNNVSRNATIEKVFQILPIATGTLALFAWLGSGRGGWVIPGALIATLITASLLRQPDGAKPWALLIIGYILLCFSGVIGMDNPKNPGFLMFAQMLWGISFLTSMIALPIVKARYVRAYAKDKDIRKQQDLAKKQAREAKEKEDRIAEKRRLELEHSTRIARQRKWADRASGPGIITGFEPQDLESISLVPHTHMHGNPGAGLSGSGFDESNIKIGQQGEFNFAKVLQSQGMLDTFASFWSVQMPDAEIGASDEYNTDIDCILVSRNAVWLIDVKNYVQGSVTWHRETGTHERTGREAPHLIAVDNETGGYVGKPRPMSRNMQLATNRFTKRFEESGLQFAIRPVVVMMPRRDGLGTINDVTWPDEIPATSLPHFLQWISQDQPFDPHSEDSTLITGILQSLLKEENGSALKIGERPASTHTAGKGSETVYEQSTSTASAETSSSGVVAASSATGNPPEQTKNCNSCNGAVEADWSFCYNCGASF